MKLPQEAQISKEEMPENISVFRFGRVIALQTNIPGKSMFNSYPRESPVKYLDAMTQMAVERELTIVSGLTMNRVESDDTVAGSTIVLVLALAPDELKLESIPDITGKTEVRFLNEERFANSYGATCSIPGGVIEVVASRFSVEATYPLLEFTHNAVKILGPDIFISVDDLRNSTMRCSAIRRSS